MTWYITGNSNIDPTKFLGTTNNQPLIIKTNQLADNTAKMRINPDGNVGIAKAPSATYKLDVAGTINATDVHKNGSPLSVSQWTDASGGISYAGGNVGIGTTNPSTAMAGGRAVHVDNPTGGSALRLGDGTANGQRWEWQSTVINGVGAMNLSKLNAPAGNPLTVLASGNVGIGTTGALYRLHVVAPGGFGPEDSGGVSLAGNVPLIAQANNTAIGVINGSGRQAFALNIDFNGGTTNARGVPTLYDKYDGGWHQCLSLKNGRVGIGTYDPQGGLDVGGDIRAGNSDIYFTRTDHNHTGIGNTADYAAIENAANYGALMILGRSGTPRGRYVRLWDYLQVNGGLDVTGNAFKPGGGSWSSISDVRVKKCVIPLTGALEKLSRLRGVSFEWKNPEEQGNLTGEQMGLVAQEVEEVFPEWISTDPDGYKNMTIRGFEALAVEAFKHLKAENESLRAGNNELRLAMAELRARIVALEPA